MGAEPFLGEIMLFAGDFAPRGWALCDGRTLAINQNTALFSLLGTTYGGNGQTTFALPDLRGRYPMSAGEGPGLTSRVIGEMSGTEQTSILLSQMPAHTHTLSGSSKATGTIAASKFTIASTSAVKCSTGQGVADPSGAYPGDSGNQSYNGTSNATMASDMVTTTSAVTADVPLDVTVALSGNTGAMGSGLPVANMPPYLALNYCIAMEGIFPSRQ